MIAYLFSCEHATCTVPEAYREYFHGSEEALTSKEGWEPGALNLSQAFAMRFRTPLVHGDVTRLLIDLEKDGDQRWSRFSEKISESMRLRMVDRYERVFRQQLRQRIADDLRRYDSVVHVMVHTDPNHGGRVSLVTPEKSVMGEALAGECCSRLRLADVDARCVSGADTGAFAMVLARENDPARYAQIRLEVSQNFFLEGKPLRWETLKKILLDGLEQAVAASS
ncbi:MAG: N-formylglutamate amidohydrolase [Luteolibacter sp.]